VNDDTQLINETLAGSHEAYGRLVCAYQNRLYNMLVHVTGCESEAEEVAQEAFVQAYRKLNSFEGRAGFYTWLYRIAFNLWISRRRKKRPERSIEAAREATGQEPTDQQDTPAEQMERRERIELIRVAISQLPDEFRSVLVLREIDGSDYESIAQILDLPIGTVRSRLHRARLMIKRQLEMVLGES
jgi:RNA polymerase sigma-70 factor (ECF subfamily)